MTAAEAKNAKKITKKQKAVLDFIAQTIEETGIAPTVRDICVGLGLSSPLHGACTPENTRGKGVHPPRPP